MRIHYEVNSELNPAYTHSHQRGLTPDYYGVYWVELWHDDRMINIVQRFDDPFEDRRTQAYDLARTLQAQTS